MTRIDLVVSPEAMPQKHVTNSGYWLAIHSQACCPSGMQFAIVVPVVTNDCAESSLKPLRKTKFTTNEAVSFVWWEIIGIFA